MTRIFLGLWVLAPVGCGSTVTPLGDAGFESHEAGFAITGPSTLRTHELGVSDRVFVALTTKPVSDVSLHVAVTDGSEGAVSVRTLTFTQANWDTPRRVEVTGVAEAGLDGDVEHELRLTVVSDDPAYSHREIESIPILNEDFVVERVSVPAPHFDATGHRGAGETAISNGGRQVAFETYATLAPEDTHADVQDVYVHDRDTGKTELLSAYTDGPWDARQHGFIAGKEPAITPDGRYVSFISPAPLDRDIRNADEWRFDIYVSDRYAPNVAVERVTQEDRAPRRAALSADGRFVAFGGYSDSSSRSSHIPLRFDRLTGTVEEGVEKSPTRQLPVATAGPAISSDGTTLLFTSISRRLVPGVGQEPPTLQVFYETGFVDFNANDDARIFWPSTARDLDSRSALSHDGKTLSFSSDGQLVVADMRPDPYVTRWIGPGQWASLSSDGRFMAFQSEEDFLGTRRAGDEPVQHVYVVDLKAERIAVASLDDRGKALGARSSYPALSPDGAAISFSTASDDVVAGDDNGVADAFVVELDAGFWHRASELPLRLVAQTQDGGWAPIETQNPGPIPR